MALRKPSEYFVKKVETDLPIVEEPVDSLHKELSKVENLSEQINQLQQELTEKVVKTDLENLIISQINEMRDNFDYLKNQIYQSNQTDIFKFKEVALHITQTVNNLIENEIPKYKKQITGNELRVSNQFENFKEEVEERVEKFYEVLKEFNDVVQIIETVSNIERYIGEHHSDLITLREEIFQEIEQIPVGNIQENLERLEKKIDYIRETYSRIEPEVVAREIIQEGLLNEPPEIKNQDPLTSLDQNFVTLDQLQEHYRLFINRIQQQLSTFGGGGETRLKYLDDIIGIATNAASYDGKFLKYNHSLGKFEFVTVSGGGGGSQTLDDTLQLGNTSSLGMSVGVVTASLFVKSSGTSNQFLKADGSVDSSVYATQTYVGLSTVGLGRETYWEKNSTGINTSSNVGIGTTNAQYKLSITDNTSSTSGLTNVLADFSGNVNSFAQVNIRNAFSGTNSSSDLVLTADNGNNTLNFLDLGINNTGFATGTWTINGPTDGYLYASDGNLSLGVGKSTSYLSLFSGGTLAENEKVRFTNNGVGIGTTLTPAFLNVSGDVIFEGSTTTELLRVTQLGTGPALLVEHGTRNDTNAFVILNSGQVGIGVLNPSGEYALEVDGGDIRFVTGSQGDLIISHQNLVSYVRANTSVQLGLGANNQDAIRINLNNNVGIGTSVANEKLQVNGNVRVGFNTSQGVILTSPNGTKYKLFVENDGTLKTVAV